jgi:hypothetical protein
MPRTPTIGALVVIALGVVVAFVVISLVFKIRIEFDPSAAWDERKLVYEMSDLIVDSLSVTAAAEGAANGDWTCAVAAAVFRFAMSTRTQL